MGRFPSWKLLENSPLSGTKKGHKHKQLWQKLPLPDPPPPRDPWPAKFFMFGASFPFKRKEKGPHKEFRPGGVLGARNSLCGISSRAFFAPDINQQTRVYPYPLTGSVRPNPKMGVPDPENPGLRPWSETMVSERARPWGRGSFAKPFSPYSIQKRTEPQICPPKTIAGTNFGQIWGSGRFWML